MNFNTVAKIVGSKIRQALDETHGVLFSAADLSEAMTAYKYAANGQRYHHELGVYDTFDVTAEAGLKFMDEARDKLLKAKGAYDRTFGNSEHMLSSDSIIREELGISL
ncbi:MAG: hypothetical protein JKY71_01150 [Alphaproteobacteria bacterium]|nr:hypothetical protein [Alphaproteobacteria bacterium]